MSSKRKIRPTEVRLWGETTEESRKKVPDDVLWTLIRGAVKQEDPKKLPNTEEEDENCFTLPVHLSKPNEYVIHTIKLNEHAKTVQSLIDSLVPGKIDFEVCPPIPKMNVDNKGSLNEETLKSMHNYKFALGQSPELPVLNNENINLMLQKAVLTTLAETGFDKAKMSTVYVLIDVVRDILTKVSKMLHFFSQQDVMRDHTTYKDPLEKVLQLLGLSGVNDLFQFYNKDVIGKRQLALKQSTNLVNQYNGIVHKMKEQAAIEADEANVPEISFTSINPNDYAIQNSFETGFQLLLDFEPNSHSSNIKSTKEIILNGESTKTIIKTRISSNSLQGRRKKQKQGP